MCITTTNMDVMLVVKNGIQIDLVVGKPIFLIIEGKHLNFLRKNIIKFDTVKPLNIAAVNIYKLGIIRSKEMKRVIFAAFITLLSVSAFAQEAAPTKPY